MRLLLLGATFLALGAAPAFAASSQFQVGNHELIPGSVLETSTDGATAQPAGTSANPIYVTGGGGGGSSGTVGAAGTNGTTAQSVQGIMGGVPVPVSGSLTTTPGPIYGQNGTSADSTSNPLATNIAQIGGVTVSLGQTTMSASMPVTIASNQSALAVTGTFYQATQPVSLASLPALATGANTIGSVNQGTSPWVTADSNILLSYAAQGGTAPSGGIGMEGEYLSTLPTLTTGQMSREMLDANGRQILGTSSATIGTVTAVTNGSVGADFSSSVNHTALPSAVGATVGTSTYGGSGPFAAYILIATDPALSTRANVDIENISGAPVVVVRDDGTAATGAAPVNASWFMLSGGSGAPSQGGAWSSTTFRGRIQIWAAAVPTYPPTVMGD